MGDTSTKPSNLFHEAADAKAFDREHRRKLNFNIDQYLATLPTGRGQYADMELARRKAKNIKWKVMASLDTYLLEFERQFEANGGKVIWAKNAAEARTAVLDIFKKHEAKSAVKAKSMATEEIELNHALEAEGYGVHETDLGEFIVQLSGEKPYHIVTPAMHKSKEDVAKLFHEKLGVPEGLSPRELTLEARKQLREKYVNADIGISGANFLIADTGAIAITENEGNARLSTSFPKTHIAIVGLEKIIPSIKDLSTLWPLLATHGTGQKVTVYNTILNGPKKHAEVDGPENMYVILMDNGRTNVLRDPKLRESLYCIRCGACLNVCPVYKTIGGHSYGTTYSGPIGSVISPHMAGMESFKHLSHASSLCGNCTEICPVRINLHELLLYNRSIGVKQGLTTASERFSWKMWRRTMLKRKRMNFPGAGLKNRGLKMFFASAWGSRRALPKVKPKSFQQRWRKERGR